MRILVAGGAGYIGSHTCVELLNAGNEVVVVDNLLNSSRVALDRVARIAGKKLQFHELDVRDKQALGEVFSAQAIDAVIHFAGLKAVGESVARPLHYYRNNIDSTLSLLEVMASHDVYKLVFSSSATVYGDPDTLPIREDAALRPSNPYGRTKLFIEEILRDLQASDPRWRLSILRYFNPVGAHPSGLIGEDPDDIPNNLMPYITQVAIGRRDRLEIFGGDYPTPDGTGVRDYIHVVDLARGHLHAVARLQEMAGLHIHNLGTGKGLSVLEVVNAFAAACDRPVPYEIVGRRPGDVPGYYGDPTLAATELGWQAGYDLDAMCRDSWNWQQSNPQGYRDGGEESRS
jgi:UDP-glucose 4-epimerase